VLDYLRPIGDFQADNVRRQYVVSLRNKIAGNTRTQDLFVQAVSAMFGIGMDLGFSDGNPAARIPRLNDPQSYEPWPLAAHQKFIASDMPQWMRTAYMLGLWTAQREGDILRLARARYDGTGFTIRQGRPEAKRGKGRKGKIVEPYIRAAKPLRDYLAKCTLPGLLFVTDESGKPIPPTFFRHSLRTHLDALGLTNLHFHGLRHTTATALAELGAPDAEIQAYLGHQTRQMAERYTKKANQQPRRQRVQASGEGMEQMKNLGNRSSAEGNLCSVPSSVISFLSDCSGAYFGGCSWTRTCDPLIKRTQGRAVH
jgi:integrase